jgi:cell division protein FtsL
MRKYGDESYIYGNTVVREDPYYGYAEPEREEQVRQRRQNYEKARRRSEIRNRNDALTINFYSLVILSLAAVSCLFICCNYLRVQSSVTSKMKKIESMESKIEKIKNENDALEARINSYVNLDNVYKVATGELGMVYASKDQVITYDKTESEYVRQYEDIPK